MIHPQITQITQIKIMIVVAKEFRRESISDLPNASSYCGANLTDLALSFSGDKIALVNSLRRHAGYPESARRQLK
jgi:hypothetical protein